MTVCPDLHLRESNSDTTEAGVALIFDRPHTSAPDHFGLLSGWQWDSLRSKCLQAGLRPSSLQVLPLNQIDCLKPSVRVIVGFGESVLQQLTGKKSIDKWHLSPLKYGERTVIPTFDLGRANRQYELGTYQTMALRRAAEEFASPARGTPERFLLNPGLEETLAVLDMIAQQPEVSCDVETGYGQINTVGFAWSPSEAIAINVLPDRCGDRDYYEIWKRIAAILEGGVGKIFQNFIYDTSYFSAYGIRTRNITHDTMHAMKVLWPEFDSNLGNVGRIYTRRTYWKDDGRVESEEGKKKDWGAVRDWTKHYLYNCRDTTGTFEAAQSQREDLKVRGLNAFYNHSVLRLTGAVAEMCARGMPLDVSNKARLKTETETRIEELTQCFQDAAGDVNPRSSQQVLRWLKGQGITPPKIFDKKTGQSRSSADAKSLKKVLMKHPDLSGLKELQQIKTLDKALSSYIDFDVRPDGRLSYSLNITGTETLRFSGGTDPWERGFNIQTIPREGGAVSIKSMFVAPEGWTFIEADLKAAETYYVAYASVCKKLIDMLHSGEDIHKHVAHAILRALGRPATDYTKKWRDLGKKTGHGANYLMKEGTFTENVFKEMDMILSKKEGKAMLEAYFAEFPEIRLWHGEIDRELYTKRRLRAPTGWERYFYGRPGPDMLREAIPWAPQHTVPWIINQMMFHLIEERRRGNLKFHLICQVHDALYLLVPDDWVERVGRACAVENWQRGLDLPGGKLVIPIELEVAKCLAEKTTLKI